MLPQDAGPRFHEASRAALVSGELEEGRVRRELIHERLVGPVEERLEADGQALREVRGEGPKAMTWSRMGNTPSSSIFARCAASDGVSGMNRACMTCNP